MKKLFTIGEFQVSVELFRIEDTVGLFVAKCGKSIAKKKMSVRGPHNHPAAQHDIDVDNAARSVAEQAAGMEQSRLNFDRTFAEEAKPPAPLPLPEPVIKGG